jgi:hypothetical protein
MSDDWSLNRVRIILATGMGDYKDGTPYIKLKDAKKLHQKIIEDINKNYKTYQDSAGVALCDAIIDIINKRFGVKK